MWLLSTLMTGVLIIGLAVVIYSLGVGTVELVSKIKSNQNYRKQLKLDADYEREFYADVFENILLDNSYQLPQELRLALSLYVDSVRSSKVVR